MRWITVTFVESKDIKRHLQQSAVVNPLHIDPPTMKNIIGLFAALSLLSIVLQASAHVTFTVATGQVRFNASIECHHLSLPAVYSNFPKIAWQLSRYCTSCTSWLQWLCYHCNICFRSGQCLLYQARSRRKLELNHPIRQSDHSYYNGRTANQSNSIKHHLVQWSSS